MNMASAKYVSLLSPKTLVTVYWFVCSSDVPFPYFAFICTVLRPETILTLLSFVEEKYGSVDGYFKAKTSLTEEDLEAIRQGLLVTA